MLAPAKAKRILIFCLDVTFYNGVFGSGFNLSYRIMQKIQSMMQN